MSKWMAGGEEYYMEIGMGRRAPWSVRVGELGMRLISLH